MERAERRKGGCSKGIVIVICARTEGEQQRGTYPAFFKPHDLGRAKDNGYRFSPNNPSGHPFTGAGHPP